MRQAKLLPRVFDWGVGPSSKRDAREARATFGLGGESESGLNFVRECEDRFGVFPGKSTG
jgi:hypothetical protein